MEKSLAKVLSYLLHPLFMPFYGVLIIFSLNTYVSFIITFKGKLIILAVLLATTILLPLLTISIMKMKKLVSSWTIERKEERIFPFMFTALFYYLAFYLLKNMDLPGVYYMFILGANMLLILTLIINFWWKISIHMVGIGGLLGAMIGISQLMKIDIHYILAGIILLGGLLGFARLKNNSHSPAQIYSGFAMGAVGMIFLFLGF